MSVFPVFAVPELVAGKIPQIELIILYCIFAQRQLI